MWTILAGQTIQMVDGDYGLELPIMINGVTLGGSDEIMLKIARGNDVLIEKTYGNISDNKVNPVLSEAETALLPVGNYCWGLDWYRDGVFMCNVVARNGFKVVDKL